MTIGKNSKKSAQAPQYLDKSSGFYCRLEEAELRDDIPVRPEGEKNRKHNQEPGMFDFNRGMLDDDGTKPLVRRKSSQSSKRKKQREGSARSRERRLENPEEGGGIPEQGDRTADTAAWQTDCVHFAVLDDHQILLDEKRTEKNPEEKVVKTEKRSTMKRYRKAIDRAFRRGWETFITSLYSVTLTPISSSSSSSPSAEHRSAIVD
ncbi:uncharacterized protein sb:cb1058 [Polyodon spathula]|uniref:uncharacterized protein sb:cb1058 n=1 Tax=Polyodon spathula TaxID=7913 RepID=UPI001B7F6223|nr:uncharacterized protein sb:cb1058 [Polyodon spathula]